MTWSTLGSRKQYNFLFALRFCRCRRVFRARVSHSSGLSFTQLVLYFESGSL